MAAAREPIIIVLFSTSKMTAVDHPNTALLSSPPWDQATASVPPAGRHTLADATPRTPSRTASDTSSGRVCAFVFSITLWR